MTPAIIYIIIFAYLIGSIPFGLVLAKTFKSVDLREIGSGNIGATNARRAGGWGLGLATLACDVLKGTIPVLIASAISQGNENGLKEVWVALTAISAFCGHLFPVYLKFKTGGKGVATAVGCFAVISPIALAISIVAFIIAAGISNRVSAGSLAAAATLPISVFWLNQSLMLFGCALLISLAIIFRHKDNIKRLFAGTEPTIGRD
ncbi:MAG: glycerol-3-phosphate 1-O-acyltransferase PlsY [Desulfobacteraceae bacterium]|nr:glycerol-3-phosphate 1-O-acyltransferase PlsY [Desulfobacteraceae bacterium]MBC2755548.1 glycerol-3-phosphate 1-O-acyltransferase PlsY [Desulfobacteraceae bacterium]